MTGDSFGSWFSGCSSPRADWIHQEAIAHYYQFRAKSLVPPEIQEVLTHHRADLAQSRPLVQPEITVGAVLPYWAGHTEALRRASPRAAHTVVRAGWCSAPLESSHLSDFARPEFARAPIAQCLVWALFVVPADPRGQLTPRVVEAGEVVLPDAFLSSGCGRSAQ